MCIIFVLNIKIAHKHDTSPTKELATAATTLSVLQTWFLCIKMLKYFYAKIFFMLIIYILC